MLEETWLNSQEFTVLRTLALRNDIFMRTCGKEKTANVITGKGSQSWVLATLDTRMLRTNCGKDLLLGFRDAGISFPTSGNRLGLL